MKKYFWINFSLLVGLLIVSTNFYDTVKATSFVHTLYKTHLSEKGDMTRDFSYQFNTVKKRHLNSRTNWYTDQLMPDSENNHYYRVSTNEWVDTDDVALVNEDFSQPLVIDTPRLIFVLNPKTYEFKSSGQRLPAGTWATSERITLPRGVSYSKVGTNQWIQNIHY